MRAKKAKEPPRLIRYLLSADRRLRRISLRKMPANMPVPAKKAKNAPRAARARRAAQANDARLSRTTIDPRAVVTAGLLVLLLFGLLFGAAMIAARQPSRQAPAAIADAQPGPGAPLESRTRSELLRAASTPRPETKKTAAPKAAAVESVRSVRLPATTSTTTSSTTTAEPLADSSPAASDVATRAASVENGASVTITGCLEHDDNTFWLADTAGADAPTSRSWKSAFLRKRPSRIELVDAGHALRLPNYVGQRIAATGRLVNREMQTRSLYRVATTCR